MINHNLKHYNRTKWYEGWDAARAGKPWDANPYPHGSTESIIWKFGHLAGRESLNKKGNKR